MVLTDRAPRAAPVRFRYLPGFRMIRQIGDNVLEHLRPGALLHAREFRRRVAGPFAVHHFRQDPLSAHGRFGFVLLNVCSFDVLCCGHLPEHGALLEHRLLPQIRLVCADLVACHHRDLIARWLVLDARRHPNLWMY